MYSGKIAVPPGRGGIVEILYRVIINDCPITVGVDDVVECAASLIT
jgi:hypothetical protein